MSIPEDFHNPWIFEISTTNPEIECIKKSVPNNFKKNYMCITYIQGGPMETFHPNFIFLSKYVKKATP